MNRRMQPGRMSAMAWACCVAWALSACGGGNDGNSSHAGSGGSGNVPAQDNGGSSPEPIAIAEFADPCTSPGQAYGVTGLSTAGAGRQASVFLLGCTGAISDPQWVQTEGPQVSLLSARSQVIAFDAPSAGTYGFTVSFKTADGVARSQAVRLAVAASPASASVQARLSQAVRMGGGASVRAWPLTGKALGEVQWTQVSGPPVTLKPVDELAVQFTAPDVERDQLVRLRVSTNNATTGAVDTDDAVVLIEHQPHAAANDQDALWTDTHASRVYAYRSASKHAANLMPCVYEPQQRLNTLCTLGRLPLLGQETGGNLPTGEQVMDRVLVSHDWVGANFEQFLRTYDTRGDFRRMLMSTTAVVLGTHVRPSFYAPTTGAIYLDADFFWLIPEERDTIDEIPDYRSGYSATLAFKGAWRYVKNNQSVHAHYPANERRTRTLADSFAAPASLLYHELTHALDFAPPSLYGQLGGDGTLLSSVMVRYNLDQLPSQEISRLFPLTSAEMSGLGQVMFQGKPATDLEKSYTADQVAAFFASDLATDDYAYSTPQEDFAMGIEEMMMSLRWGIQRDVAYLPFNVAANAVVNDVRWGQRGRVGDARIKARVREAASRVIPWMTAADIDSLPAPQMMRVGDTWAGNLVLGTQAGAQRASALGARDEAFNEPWMQGATGQRRPWRGLKP